MAVSTLLAVASLPDAEIVARVCGGETSLFEILMRRHNERVYRAARSIVKDEAEAEDVMQQAYINAFVHLRQFEDRSQFSTWLTRITIHEALSRRRKWKPDVVAAVNEEQDMDRFATEQPDPERRAYASELAQVIESAVDALPEGYRAVFMLRDIQGLTTSETAEGLELGEEAVKTRLHRARAMIRRHITERLGAAAARAFPFHAVRCDRVVGAVLGEIRTRRLSVL